MHFRYENHIQKVKFVCTLKISSIIYTATFLAFFFSFLLLFSFSQSRPKLTQYLKSQCDIFMANQFTQSSKSKVKEKMAYNQKGSLFNEKIAGHKWSRYKSMSRTNNLASVKDSTFLSVYKTLLELCLNAFWSMLDPKLIAILTRGKRKTICIMMDMQVSVKMSKPINSYVKQQCSFRLQVLWQLLNEGYPLCHALESLQPPCAFSCRSCQCLLAGMAHLQDKSTHSIITWLFAHCEKRRCVAYDQ